MNELNIVPIWIVTILLCIMSYWHGRSLMHKVYSDVDAQLRREFGVNTYKAIKRSQCDLAVEIIKKYELPRCLREEIEDENSQMCFAV